MLRGVATIEKAKAQIADAIQTGFSIGDISELSAMIQDISVLETYMEEFEEHAEESAEIEYFFTFAEDELSAAEKYHNKWVETSNIMYRNVAKDELRHAEGFISLLQQKVTNSRRLQSIIEKHSELAAKLA